VKWEGMRSGATGAQVLGWSWQDVTDCLVSHNECDKPIHWLMPRGPVWGPRAKIALPTSHFLKTPMTQDTMAQNQCNVKFGHMNTKESAQSCKVWNAIWCTSKYLIYNQRKY